MGVGLGSTTGETTSGPSSHVWKRPPLDLPCTVPVPSVMSSLTEDLSGRGPGGRLDPTGTRGAGVSVRGPHGSPSLTTLGPCDPGRERRMGCGRPGSRVKEHLVDSGRVPARGRVWQTARGK